MKVDVKENVVERKFHIPHLGQRILKTAVAVFLCLIIYMLRGYDGMVTQSTVAAIICIQPYRSDMLTESANRIIGTLTGAAWALLFLYCMKFTVDTGLRIPMVIVYLLMAVGIVVTLYTTVVLKKTDAASLSAIVFISIVATYPNLETPVAQTVDRIVDTFIGILVAGLVNAVSLPRIKHEEYLFFIRLQDLVPDRFSHVSSNILVMLNRLYNEGAKICLVSKWAPAFLLSQMGVMSIGIPVIVMDGAALYDIPNREYVDMIPMSAGDAYFLRNIFRGLNHGYCIGAVRDSSLMIYRRGPVNWAETQEYELMKRSPYRNYIDGDFVLEDKIAFLRLIDTDLRIDKIEKELANMIPEGKYRMERRPQPKMKGYSGLYFYHPDATVENMKKRLIDRMESLGYQNLVPVDMNLKDAYVSDNEAIALLNKTRSIYEPVWLPWRKT
jgi:hypothetical protein